MKKAIRALIGWSDGDWQMILVKLVLFAIVRPIRLDLAQIAHVFPICLYDLILYGGTLSYVYYDADKDDP
jgi:hypothetical protein